MTNAYRLTAHAADTWSGSTTEWQHVTCDCTELDAEVARLTALVGTTVAAGQLKVTRIEVKPLCDTCYETLEDVWACKPATHGDLCEQHEDERNEAAAEQRNEDYYGGSR